MPAHAIASATISFGLVSIPVKAFTAASSEQTRFNMLHKKCNGRLKMQYFCPVDNEVVERKDTHKGYEYKKGQYVHFTEEELKTLESERSSNVEIVEFVPLASVDFVHVEKSYYLGPEKGGDKAYRLLSESMRSSGRVAVGRWGARGKDQLVLIRPYGKDGLILHQLYYANEVRSFEEIDTGGTYTFTDAERGMAGQLIGQLSTDEFDAEKYRDSYEERITGAVEQKVRGQEVTAAPEAPRAQIIDLFEALKRSLEPGQAKKSEAIDEAPLKPPKKAERPARRSGKSTQTG